MIWMAPLLCWAGLMALLLRRGIDWRDAWLAASLLWGATVTLLTELLSFGRLLSPGPLAVCWGSLAFVVVGLLLLRRRHPWPSHGQAALSQGDWTLLGGTGLLCLLTFVIALIAPPNNYDSMTYHLSRVAHWQQNRSIAHYPTHIVRQLDMNPWAEFAILHLQILSGGDRLANLVQWFSMLGSLVGVSRITALFGGGIRSQVLAALFAATLPMGVLQASSTQNDWVLAFWLVCLLWSGLCLADTGGRWWMWLFGLALGLAVLTKGTAYPYVLPIVVWIAILTWRRFPALAPRFVLLAALLALLMNAGHFQRNFRVFTTPFLSDGHRYANAVISPGTVVSNGLRGMALHLATPVKEADIFVEKAVGGVHELFALDPDDPATTWENKRFRIPTFKLHEDTSGNPLHLLLIMAIIAGLLVKAIRERQWRSPHSCALAVLFGAVLFCALLRWQPWHSRLHLPLFILMAPVCAWFVSAGVGRYLPGMIAVSIVLLLVAIPYVVFNYARPLLPLQWLPISVEAAPPHDRSILFVERERQYFAGRPDLEDEYLAIARSIHESGAASVGLWIGWDGYEYPLWALLHQHGDVPVIRHVRVGNPSAVLMDSAFRPQLLLTIDGNGARLSPGAQK